MNSSKYQKEREKFYAAINDILKDSYDDEAGTGVLTKFFLIAEVSFPPRNGESRRTLSYRAGDINQEGLRSWEALGLIKSAELAIQEQHFGTTEYVEDDDETEQDDGT